MYYVLNKERYCQMSDVPWSILFLFACLCSLFQWNWKIPILKVVEIFQYFSTNEKWWQIWISPMKNIWFCFISIAWIYFSYRTEKFWFWKSLQYLKIFGKKRCSIRFKYVSWKNVWFCFIFIVWVHFSYKIEKFRFWKLLKYFNICGKRRCNVRFNMSHRKLSDLI